MKSCLVKSWANLLAQSATFSKEAFGLKMHNEVNSLVLKESRSSDPQFLPWLSAKSRSLALEWSVEVGLMTGASGMMFVGKLVLSHFEVVAESLRKTSGD